MWEAHNLIFCYDWESHASAILKGSSNFPYHTKIPSSFQLVARKHANANYISPDDGDIRGDTVSYGGQHVPTTTQDWEPPGFIRESGKLFFFHEYGVLLPSHSNVSHWIGLNLTPTCLLQRPHLRDTAKIYLLKVVLRPKNMKKIILFFFGFQNYVNWTLTDPSFKFWF